MGIEKLKDITMWIAKELIPMDHGELHVTLKVRDGKVALIEKTKIVKENGITIVLECSHVLKEHGYFHLEN